jgi:hypothetical protein
MTAGRLLQTQWSPGEFKGHTLTVRARNMRTCSVTICCTGAYFLLIVQIEIDLVDQAESIRRNKELREQVQNMESLAPKGSAVFLYSPDRHRAIEGQTYINELRTDARILRDKVSGLGSF